MTISKTHQKFARLTNNQRALSHPEEFLGPNWKDVLNFWFFIDTLSEEQIRYAERRFWNLDVADRISARNLAFDAATDTIMCHSDADEAFMATPGHAVGNATRELIGAHKILEQGKELKIIQLFLDL
jgi:hypothetical protein